MGLGVSSHIKAAYTIANMTNNSLNPTSEKDFTANLEQGKTQLMWRWIAADLETPVSAYLKLCGEQKYSFLLESVEGGENLGRYSIIGLEPDMIWRCQDKVAYRDGMQQDQDALTSLRTQIKDSHIDIIPESLPPMAASGLFGYLGYDMIRLIEDIPQNNPDDLEIPDSIMIRPTILAIFDNVKNMICLVAPCYIKDGYADELYNNFNNKLQEIENRLGKAIPESLSGKTSLSVPLEVSPNMKKDDYLKAVEKAKNYILEGEIFQVVAGQRFSVDFDLPAFDLYRSLRRLNPSPFLFHLAFDDFALVGSSPEILVRVRDNTLTIRPIAGTRPRGKDSAEDEALKADLLADPKECAEHLMLLDLGRNDVGRVADFGTVNVTDQYMIELYSHVMHIVSNVEGKLKSDCDIVDALFAGFPAGTVSGAPKVRAMEIIDELETSKRGYYAGAVGYLSGNGDMDTCIALRTALVKNGKIHVQAGGGLVADSNPEDEYTEAVNKSRAIIAAAEMAVERACSNN